MLGRLNGQIQYMYVHKTTINMVYIMLIIGINIDYCLTWKCGLINFHEEEWFKLSHNDHRFKKKSLQADTSNIRFIQVIEYQLLHSGSDVFTVS